MITKIILLGSKEEKKKKKKNTTSYLQSGKKICLASNFSTATFNVNKR